MKTFRQAMQTQEFVLSAELHIDSHSDAASLVKQAQILTSAVDAVQVTDNPGENAHISPIAASSILLSAGIDPVLHMNCRDRNRIALRSDLLGAAALGVSSLLIMRGKKISSKSRPHIKSVYDWGARKLTVYAHSMKEANFLIGSIATVFKPDRGWKPDKITRKADAGARFIQTQLCFDADILRHYMARLVAEKMMSRIDVIVGIAPLPSADIAQWLGKNLRGAVVPAKLVKRLRQSKDAELEGISVCAEFLHEAAHIPGVSGANLTPLGNPEAVVEAIQLSGIRT